MPAPLGDTIPLSSNPLVSSPDPFELPLYRPRSLSRPHRPPDLQLSRLDTPETRRSQPKAKNSHPPPNASNSSIGLLDPTAFSPSSPSSPAASPPMPPKRRPRNQNGSVFTDPTDLPTDGGPKGHATGAMASSLREQRRKHVVLDSPTSSSQATHLMSQSSFSLDHGVPEFGHRRSFSAASVGFHMDDGDGSGSKGFSELPRKDKRNFLLLVLLYFLQGVPMGLASGSVPFLLKSHVGYSEMGVFSLASYPYSLKLLWSPIVDAIWSRKLGRRKSWILPIQTISGLGMLWLGARAEAMMDAAGMDGGAGIWGFTSWWFMLVFMCATQDIAVDGWALTLLSTENLSYASTAQTVGLTAGSFLSSTVFLAFSSKDFANKWFRTIPGDTGLITLGGALTVSGWLYLLVTVGLAAMKREEYTKNSDGVWDVYKIMGGILKLKNIQTLLIVHLIAKIGFQANDAVTSLKLLDKGLKQEELALTVLIDFPFEIFLGYYVGKWSQTIPPMKLWCWGFVGRLIAAGIAQTVVMFFPSAGVNTPYFLGVIFQHVLSTFMNTVMFVAVSAFHARIADPVIGGTYMTLLATVTNLGGTFPRFFILKFVDMFTVASCIPPTTPLPPDALKGDPITAAFSCVAEPEKQRCAAGGGTCNISTDGYYIVNVLCIIIGVVTFWGFIKPAVLKLQALPMKAWRLSDGS